MSSTEPPIRPSHGPRSRTAPGNQVRQQAASGPDRVGARSPCSGFLGRPGQQQGRKSAGRSGRTEEPNVVPTRSRPGWRERPRQVARVVRGGVDPARARSRSSRTPGPPMTDSARAAGWIPDNRGPVGTLIRHQRDEHHGWATPVHDGDSRPARRMIRSKPITAARRWSALPR